MIRILGENLPQDESTLTPEALGFVARLQRRFGPEREHLIEARKSRTLRLASGGALAPLDETSEVRQLLWTVAPPPPDLERRQVEITGPVDTKRMIDALTSGADAFMADFEDALSPTWRNLVDGQRNLKDAVRATLFHIGANGRESRLRGKLATLIVRPRGWHLIEQNVAVDDEPVSASLFDFGMYFFHNAHELIARSSAPYFCLPKIESYLEARLWNEVFIHAQREFGIPVGTIRATVPIETLPAAFEMDEILWELREHIVGLNVGQWDYLFSIVKTLSFDPKLLFPDRRQLGMNIGFMRAYGAELIRTCHRRGAHAMGGASHESRDVRIESKQEASQGFDGARVTHPDLVPIAHEVFRSHLGDRPHQKGTHADDAPGAPGALLDFTVPNGKITEAGFRDNIAVALTYIDLWLCGSGTLTLQNRTENLATAEIARSQLWQWLRHGGVLDNGRTLTPRYYSAIRDEECARLGGPLQGRLKDALRVLDELVLNEDFVEFLTLEAYPRLGTGAAEALRAS